MTTIQARVNTRLLSKASRLFTGTLAGRIIEILQNARRAGAKHVEIANRDGTVAVRDDGQGIEDFEKLLDLGGSGWEEKLEESEDPAGVGLFCLAPRELTIRSNNKKLTIAADGWTGAPVEILDDAEGLPASGSNIAAGVGTELVFKDEPWNSAAVKSVAVFTGMDLTVDDEPCPKERFIHGRSSLHQELGCQIKVVARTELTAWHQSAPQHREYGHNVLVNFHGQVVSFSHRPVSEHDLCFLVDMTHQPTGIRLMLPARTCLVENEAFNQVKAALELEAFRYLQQQGRHRLPYKEYLRARELGIELSEAEPTYRVGLLYTDMVPEPVEMTMPKGHPLARCYRLAESEDGDDTDEANVHLLAALGRFDQPFVPVEIRREYEGYSWAKLPTVGRVELSAGKTLQESWVCGGKLICVESILVTVHCSDGQVFRSRVPMAVKPWSGKEDRWLRDCELYVTPEVRQQLSDEQIWFHLGGFSEDGDTYDTQLYNFSQELEEFWLRLTGPDESLRRRLVDCLSDLKDWRSATILPDGRVQLQLSDGSQKTLIPSQPRAREEVRP